MQQQQRRPILLDVIDYCNGEKSCGPTPLRFRYCPPPAAKRTPIGLLPDNGGLTLGTAAIVTVGKGGGGGGGGGARRPRLYRSTALGASSHESVLLAAAVACLYGYPPWDLIFLDADAWRERLERTRTIEPCGLAPSPCGRSLVGRLEHCFPVPRFTDDALIKTAVAVALSPASAPLGGGAFGQNAPLDWAAQTLAEAVRTELVTDVVRAETEGVARGNGARASQLCEKLSRFWRMGADCGGEFDAPFRAITRFVNENLTPWREGVVRLERMQEGSINYARYAQLPKIGADAEHKV